MWRLNHLLENLDAYSYVLMDKRNGLFIVTPSNRLHTNNRCSHFVREAQCLSNSYHIITFTKVYLAAHPGFSQGGGDRNFYIQGVRDKFDTFCYDYISEFLEDINNG